MQQELSILAAKSDLASLKAEVDEIDTDKLKVVPIDLRKLKSKVDKLYVDKLAPVPVDLSKLSNVLKNDVLKKDVYNGKIKNIEYEIPDITNLATTTALTAVENKISNVSNLVKKTDCNTKLLQNYLGTKSDKK